MNQGVFQGGLNLVDVTPPGLSIALKAFKALRRKRWQYICFYAEPYFFSGAMVDAGVAGNAFFFLTDLATGQVVIDESYLGLPQYMSRVNAHPTLGCEAYFKGKGVRIELNRKKRSNHFLFTLDSKDLSIDLKFFETSDTRSFCVIGKPEAKTETFTQKTTFMKAEGSIALRGQKLQTTSASASLDFTSGQLPRVTDWRWGFCEGKTSDQKPFAINLAQGNHLGECSENVVLYQGSVIQLPEVHFDFDPEQPDFKWMMKSADGCVDLEFEPKGCHLENRNLVLISSRFSQIAGVYSGKIKLPSGQTLTLSKQPGVAEDQKVKW